MGSPVMPSEDWPPYRWLWTNVPLARDPETGEPTPYTHGFRRNTKVWLPAFILVAVALVWETGDPTRPWGRPNWRSIASLGLGFLAGHIWW